MIGFGVGRSWPLVGREVERARLLDELRHGDGILVSGDPGVGKTRLAREVADAVGEGGAVVQWVSATRAAATIPFGALAHVLPDDLSESANVSALPGRLELFQRIRRALLARADGRPLVVAVDDAHLLDEGCGAPRATGPHPHGQGDPDRAPR